MSAAEIIVWLLAPLSGRGEHHLAGWAAWHGRMMVLGWGILIPLGVLVARYAKIMPRQRWPEELDNPLWWRAHLFCQVVGMAVALAGLTIVWRSAEDDWGQAGQAHALLGWAVMALGGVQLLSGALRGTKGGPAGTPAGGPGDHFDMTLRRVVFEWVHKFGGHLTVLLGLVAIALGLAVADAPRWMAVVIAGWWTALALAAAMLQRQGRCVDTYQAIWGADARFPGNSRRLIGVGVRRLAPPPCSGDGE